MGDYSPHSVFIERVTHKIKDVRPWQGVDMSICHASMSLGDNDALAACERLLEADSATSDQSIANNSRKKQSAQHCHLCDPKIRLECRNHGEGKQVKPANGCKLPAFVAVTYQDM